MLVSVLAEKILSALSAMYLIEINSDKVSKIEHHCTASIGVFIFKSDEESEENLLQYADAAMYQAKEAGRNRIFFYS